MKQLLLFPAIILTFLMTFSGFSQSYKIDERRIYSWDPNKVPADWELEATEILTYANGGNKETKIVGYAMPGMELSYQNIKTYNVNNDIETDLKQIWNNISMQWIDTSQDSYTYYAGTSNVKDITTYSFILGYNTSKELYEFSGNDITKITYQEAELGTLVNTEKSEYAYLAPGQPNQELEYEWNGSDWDLIERSTATYSPGLREVIVEEYNGSSYNLFERYLTYYTISIEKDDEHVQQSWNGSAYVNSDRELSTYNANNNKEVYAFQTWLSNAWVNEAKFEMDYSVAAPLSTESFENESFKVFPNPTSDVINIASKIAIDKVELYNVLGKKVMQSTNTKQLNVERLGAGIYVLKVFNSNKSATKKIVIK
ncbi:T9SS type A sorting domain-containing protein [Gelatiniphilus marinus]|uniref:T9SS type A sorting domain-containing protein n=1 Tax=Gelatiniphilus marinus TaxID=1759464 RepID=A0ABW5JNY2_9FLAO